MPIIVGTSAMDGEGFPDAGTMAFLGSSGITLADGSIRDDQGCSWKWNPSNAWGPKPAPREQTTDRPGDHGQDDSTRFHGPRLFPIPFTVRAPTHLALHAARQRINDAVTITPFVFRVIEPGFDGYAMMRQQGEIEWTEGTPSSPHATGLMTLYAASPFILSSRERTFDLAFPSVTGGTGWPATWPATWDAVEISGRQVLLNPGKQPAPLTYRILGPAQTVSIAVVTTTGDVQSQNLDSPDAVQLLAAGEWLDIDTDTRQVLLNGDARRRGWVYGDWLSVPPDSEATIAIAGTGTTTESRVSGTYRASRL